MYAAIVLDHAHLACPIALAWGNPQFRARMLSQWDKFVLLPSLCVFIPLAVGVGSETTRDPAFKMLVVTYAVFNTFHFAAQNYGVCALLGGSLEKRCMAFALTVLPMALLPIWWQGVLWLVMIDLGLSTVHWAQDLRLSSLMARRQWLFTAVLLTIGLLGFAFKGVATGDHRLCFQMVACTFDRSIPILLGFRCGLGFWHFLMSRWVWSAEGRGLLT